MYPKEKETEIYKFLMENTRKHDRRPWIRQMADTFFHSIKVLKERLSSIK